MPKKKKSELILNFLRKNANKEFTIRKLAKIFRIKKQDYANFLITFSILEKNNKIVRKNKKYHSPPIYKKIIGTFDASALANNYSFGFVKTDEEDVKIFDRDCLNAYHNDIVEFIIIKRNYRGATGKILKVIERKNEYIIGNINKLNGKIFLIPDNPKIDNYIELIDLSVNQGEYVDKKVTVNITNWGDRTKNILPKGKVSEILGDANDPNIDFLSVLKQYDLPEDFSKYVVDESLEFHEYIDSTEIAKRKDFRNLITFTIDPITAKDFDDAISFEETSAGYKLYVHIADVSHYVEVDSPIFKEAFERGTSVYLLQNVIPMLPEKLSNNLCSLKSGSDRLTVSVIVEYDKNFNRMNRELVLSIIRSDSRLNYQQVDHLFEESENIELKQEIQEILFKMRPLANYLTQKRYDRGSLDFDLPDSEFEFDENGSPVNILRTKETESHLLIEEFMLEANQYIAELIAKKCSSAIFRIHEPPEPAKMGEFALLVRSYNYNLNFVHKNQNLALKQYLNSIKDENHHRVFDNLLLRSLMKAKYSYRNIGHFGLALKSYTHFTSPIRRFPDLIVHHLLKQYVFEWSTAKFSLQEIKTFAQRSSEMEVVAMNAERTLGNLKKNRFMKENIGKDFKALIVNFNNKNIFVELDKYPIEGFIPLSSITDDFYQFNNKKYCVVGTRKSRKFFLCQKVQVRVKKVEHKIEFELV
ncbi:MAG: ribonuclease R [Candidatus Cloacimonetes bacterium]|nr:ribonuclease R [Candidatus Cloacimonadota bacterium]